MVQTATVPEAKEALSPHEDEAYLCRCPHFVVELRSPFDRLKEVQSKMEEYRENGARLGLLFDPQNRGVTLYRPGVEPVLLENPDTVDCSPEMPGLVFDVTEIFAASPMPPASDVAITSKG